MLTSRRFFIVVLLTWVGAAYAADLNVIELNLFTSSTTITLQDTNCSFLIDNSHNYSIVPKSENKNIFEVSSLKIDQSSATVIFSCQNGEYVYQLRYTNTSPVLRDYNTYSYDQRKNSYGYSLGYSPNSALSQSFQLNDNSYSSLFFQFNHTEQDLTQGYYSNDFQAKYNGNYLDSGIVNNSNLGLEIGNGYSSLGRFTLFQATTGLYSYNFTFQQLKYDTDDRPTNEYILNLPLPFALQLSYFDKSDSSKEYNAQKIATFTIHNFQSNNIITYDKVIPSSAATTTGNTSNVETLTVNDFTNYFFNSFVYQQLILNYNCQTGIPCSFTSVGSSFNYQDQEVVSRVGYNPIPNQVFLYYQHFFWKNSDVTLNYNKTYAPIASLQDTPVTKSSGQSTPYQFSSLANARILKGDWLYTVTVPLVFININSYSAINIQYNSQSIGAFCSYQIMPTHTQDWSDLTWNFSLGLNYYPSYGIKQAVNLIRTHKLYGTILSNMSTPEENALVTLTLPNGKILTTHSDATGKYSFDDVPASGVFNLTAKQKQFEDTISFNKDLDVIAQEKDIQIPTYMVVQVRFILLKSSQKSKSKTEEVKNGEELSNIVNQQMEYNVVSSNLKSVYTQNKIYIRRDGIANFTTHPEFLPFKYNIHHLSLTALDTVKESNAVLEVYLTEKN